MKKRWTMREVALVMLPVLALGVYALWSRTEKTPPRSTGRYEFTLQSVEVLPATPRDVFEGFDTLVKVKYIYPSAPKLPNASPDSISLPNVLNPRLIYKTGHKFQRVNANEDAQRNASNSSFEEIVFRLSLAKLPLRYGELVFKSAMSAGYGYKVVGVGGKVTRKFLAIAPMPISVVVRKAGERVKTPKVSKYRPFKIRALRVEPPEKRRYPLRRKLIKLVIDNLQPTDKDNWRFLRPRLIDTRGNVFEYSKKVGTQYISWVDLSFPPNEAYAKNVCVRWFSFPLDLIPKSAGKITFKTDVSLNDGWPLPVSFVVRP